MPPILVLICPKSSYTLTYDFLPTSWQPEEVDILEFVVKAWRDGSRDRRLSSIRYFMSVCHTAVPTKHRPPHHPTHELHSLGWIEDTTTEAQKCSLAFYRYGEGRRTDAPWRKRRNNDDDDSSATPQKNDANLIIFSPHWIFTLHSSRPYVETPVLFLLKYS